MHEFGHAIGFHHEQTRPDRDNYIKVNNDNIESGLAYNFDKYKWGYVKNYGIRYDYWSIMHYSQWVSTVFTDIGNSMCFSSIRIIRIIAIQILGNCYSFVLFKCSWFWEKKGSLSCLNTSNLRGKECFLSSHVI